MSLQIVAGGGSTSSTSSSNKSFQQQCLFTNASSKGNYLEKCVTRFFADFSVAFFLLRSLRLPVATCCWYIISHFFSLLSLVLNTYVYACAPCAISSAQNNFPVFYMTSVSFDTVHRFANLRFTRKSFMAFQLCFGTAFYFSLTFFFHVSCVYRCWYNERSQFIFFFALFIHDRLLLLSVHRTHTLFILNRRYFYRNPSTFAHFALHLLLFLFAVDLAKVPNNSLNKFEKRRWTIFFRVAKPVAVNKSLPK